MKLFLVYNHSHCGGPFKSATMCSHYIHQCQFSFAPFQMIAKYMTRLAEDAAAVVAAAVVALAEGAAGTTTSDNLTAI